MVKIERLGYKISFFIRRDTNVISNSMDLPIIRANKLGAVSNGIKCVRILSVLKSIEYGIYSTLGCTCKLVK